MPGTAIRLTAGTIGWMLIAVAFAYAPAAGASDEPDVTERLRPSGSAEGRWSLDHSGQAELVWRSPERLPITSARPEFRIGDRLLGYPRLSADGRTLRLSGVRLRDTDRLQVWLGIRRLDGPTPTLRSRGLPGIEAQGPRDIGIVPAKPGPYDVREFEYRAKKLPWRAYPGDMEVLGHAVVPEGVEQAPLVLFLHGRHQACYGKGDNGRWPCAGKSKPVPSYRGYRYLQQRLATQGYATASISANAINQQDNREADGGARARARLVRHHLSLLAERSAVDGNAWSGRLDMGNVVLVGHSRGGEGVNQAVVSTTRSAPYDIAGQFLIAPTDFAQHTAGYTPTVVALPYCDGDVYDLQGQQYVDASVGLAPGDDAIRSSVLVRGANHNFFNTEWTPGISAAPSFDDFGMPGNETCGSRASETRLNARQQRRVSTTLTTGAVRMFVERDALMLRLFDAPGALTTKSMGERGVVWSHAVGGSRQLSRPRDGASVSGAARACRARSRGWDGGAIPKRACGRGFADGGPTPHWLQPFDNAVSRATPYEAKLTWKQPGRSGGMRFDDPLDIADRRTSLDVRMISTGSLGWITVRLRDADGRGWTKRVRVQRLLGRSRLRPFWAQTVRLNPRETGDFDPSQIVAARAVSGAGEGSVWLVDAAARRPQLPVPPERRLPRLHLGKVSVREGDGKQPGIARLPYRLYGPVDRPVKFDVAIGNGSAGRVLEVDVPAGERFGTVPIPYQRDSRDDPKKRGIRVTARAVRGVALSKYAGLVRIRDDDPRPRITLRPKRQNPVAGRAMAWTIRLSAPVDYRVWMDVKLSRVKGYRVLRGTDVPRKWLRRHGRAKHPKRPLPKLVGLYDNLRQGDTKATVRIPTVRRRGVRPKRIRVTWRSGQFPERSAVAILRPAKR